MTPPPEITARRAVARRRLAAQRLIGTPAATPVDAVRSMLAMQGQDYPGVKWSVGLRSGATEAQVEAALDAGEIVRSWPMRGTLHLVAAEDLPWMLTLTAERSTASAAQRRAILGITVDEIERARGLAIDALPGRTTLTRAALLGAIDAGGVSTAGQRGYHLLWFLAQTGTLVLGPTSGREHAFARLDAWVPSPRRLDHDEALGELALRYFSSHGPAAADDLTRWSGLTMRDVRRGISDAGPGLATVQIGSGSYLVGAETAETAAAAATDAGVLLLPGFDEYVLGYRDRAAMVAPERLDAIVPGNNGMFKATIVVDGEVVGTWGKKASARGVVVEPTPFGALSRREQAGVSEATAGYGRFLGVAARLRATGTA
jgi:hypothetical protein